MLFGIGLDLTEIPRIEEAVVKRKTFPEKILTASELELFSNMRGKRRIEFLAGRFAAKEAFSKAMGTGIGETDFLDVEVLRNEKGAPVSLQGTFSISHDGDYAMAVVLVP